MSDFPAASNPNSCGSPESFKIQSTPGSRPLTVDPARLGHPGEELWFSSRFTETQPTFAGLSRAMAVLQSSNDADEDTQPNENPGTHRYYLTDAISMTSRVFKARPGLTFTFYFLTYFLTPFCPTSAPYTFP